MKVVVVGCTHAGTAAIVNIAKMYDDAEITVYERNDNVSFLSCGIALYVGGVVKDANGLFYSSPEALGDLGVDMKMQHNVKNVNLQEKNLVVENILTGEVFEDSFDKLILTTGSWPIIPKIEGGDLENVLLSKNFEHSNVIIDKAKNAKKVVVVGAGYIGVELVEAFKENGKEVVLVDAFDRILGRYLDAEYTELAEEAFEKEGIELALGQTVQKFEGVDGKVTKVVTDKDEFEADLVIMCVGFKPNTILVQDQLDTMANGAIIVDKYMETSVKDVFAAGDSCAIHYNPTDKPGYIPLATNAVRMGTLVARNLVEKKVPYMGTQGTSGIKIYDLNISSTGLTEEAAKAEGLKVKTVTAVDNYRPEFMPTYEEVKLKVVFEEETRRLVGAQIVSKADLTQTINTLSVCIQNNMTVDEIAYVDFFFQPHFNKPWNIINLAGQMAFDV